MGFTTEKTVPAQLEGLDRLSGAGARSVPALEAAWSVAGYDVPISWREAYNAAIERYGLDGRASDEAIAFLEGLLVAMNLTSIRARRGDHVEAWIKRMRDNYNANQGHAPSDYGYRALDRLLDRYRECSDCGLTLLVEDDERGEP